MRICCPRCRRVIEGAPPDHPPRPFCSRACKLADLGDWLGETYRIPGPEASPWDTGESGGGPGGQPPSG